jgi:peptidyl-prolyl cis-trans isomerase SurA
MMIKKTCLLIGLFLFGMSVFAQNGDEILLEVGPEKVSVDEFLHIYNKNNQQKGDTYNLDSLKNYMDLFVNFKLKVVEAKNKGLDTLKSFEQELAGYRSQLAEPYLTDESVEQELIREAYERKKHDVNAAHILIEVEQDASPQDTMKAYEKAEMIRKKALSGEDFGELAREYSDDKSVRYNKGDLGWFTVFGMVYPFETAVYDTPVGEISPIVRTRFGYHIIKVKDKRPAKGRIRTAHIMVLKPKGATEEQLKKAREKVEEIQAKLEAGEDFNELAKQYSEDRRSARTGGMLPWFGVGGKMIQEFESAAYTLDTVGQISGLVETSYGYHFIKLVDTDPVGSFEEEKAGIANRISNSARASRSKDVLVDRLKKEYKTKIHEKSLEALTEKVTDSIFYGTWNPSEALKMDKNILEFADVSYTQGDFADFLRKYNRKSKATNKETFVQEKFDEFVSEKILEYEEAHLKEKYPRFKYLLKEYHDGILLFDVTDKMVWTKAVEDTAGLEAFYQKHKDDYMWDTRYDVRKVTTSGKKQAKQIKKMFKNEEDMNWAEIDSLFNTEEEPVVEKALWGKFEQGKNQQVTDLVTEYSKKLNRKGELIDSDDDMVLYIKKIEPSVKKLSEARGIITADYQNKLEKDWIKALHDKYEITVHEDVLKKIAE